MSVRDFSELVTGTTNKEWNVIIDSNCHYHVLKIAFERSNDNSSDEQSTISDVMILEELESMKRDEHDMSQPCDNLMLALRQAWGIKRLQHTRDDE